MTLQRLLHDASRRSSVCTADKSQAKRWICPTSLSARTEKRKGKKRLHLSVSIQWEAQFYTGLPRTACTDNESYSPELCSHEVWLQPKLVQS